MMTLLERTLWQSTENRWEEEGQIGDSNHLGIHCSKTCEKRRPELRYLQLGWRKPLESERF